MFNLHLLLKTNRFYLQKCTRGDDSRTSSFSTENGRTWRHSNVIYGRPIRALKISFGQGVSNWWRTGYARFGGDISFRLFSYWKKRGGAVSAPIGVRVNAGKTEITLLALVRTGTTQIQSPPYFEETTREGFTTVPDGYVFHASRRAPSRCLNARFR